MGAEYYIGDYRGPYVAVQQRRRPQQHQRKQWSLASRPTGDNLPDKQDTRSYLYDVGWKTTVLSHTKRRIETSINWVAVRELKLSYHNNMGI